MMKQKEEIIRAVLDINNKALLIKILDFIRAWIED